MEREFAKDFSYYDPTVSGIPFVCEASADKMSCQKNLFGKYHQASCDYEVTAHDYESVPPDYEIVPRSMSNVPGFHEVSRETVSFMPRIAIPCVDNISTQSAKLGCKALSDSSPKRSRTSFQPYQLRRLQYEFEHEMYIVGMKRRNLSKELDLSEKQIKIWFQNRRMKQKREYDRNRNRNFENTQKPHVENGYVEGFEAGILDFSDPRNGDPLQSQMLML